METKQQPHKTLSLVLKLLGLLILQIFKIGL